MKINWGTGIVIVMLAYMVFILYFVVRTFTLESHDHHLVSEEYYKDEINFQSEIDAKSNADKLKENIKISKTQEGLVITFPSEFNDKNVSGTLLMQRTNTDKFDIKKDLLLKDNKMIISKEKLLVGLYNIKVFWKIEDKEYLYKEQFYY